MKRESCESCRFNRAAMTGPQRELQNYCCIEPPKAHVMITAKGPIILAIQSPLPEAKYCAKHEKEVVLAG